MLTRTVLISLGLLAFSTHAQVNVAGRAPGLLVHIPEKFVREFKSEMIDYMPWLVDEEIDIDVPTNYKSGDFKFKNVRSSPIYLDWDYFGLDFIPADETKAKRSEVKITFPLITYWQIKSNINWNILNSKIFHWWAKNAQIHFQDMSLTTQGYMNINQQGFINLDTQDVTADLGRTSIQLKSGYVRNMLMRELVKVLNMISDRSLDLFPKRFMNEITKKIMHMVFGNYQFPFQLQKLNPYAMFDLDLRMVQRPLITDDFMDLYFFGQVTLNSFKESTINDPENHQFLFDSNREDNLQIIVTDRMVNTFLEAAENSGTFQFATWEPSMWTILGYNETQDLTTSSEILKDLMPELAETYGENVDVDILFFPDNAQITFQRSPVEDILADIPWRFYIMLKTGDDSMPGVQVWESVFDSVVHSDASLGLYLDKDKKKFHVYINSYTVQSIKIIEDKVGIHQRVDDFLGSVQQSVDYWVTKIDENFLKPGFVLPHWWPTFLSFDMALLEDGLLFTFVDNFS